MLFALYKCIAIIIIMNYFRNGGRVRFWGLGSAFILLAIFFSSFVLSNNASALDYVNVNQGWKFWVESTDVIKPTRIIATNDSSGEYAVFDFSDISNSQRHYNQKPNYYGHGTVPVLKDCPAHIDIAIALTVSGQQQPDRKTVMYEDEIAGPNGTSIKCDGKFNSTKGLTLLPQAPATLVEKVSLENNGNEPLGCPGYGALPPGAPQKDRNYNCPDGASSIQQGQHTNAIITPTAEDATDPAAAGEDIGMTDCESFGGLMGFIMCPFIDGIFAMVRGLDSLITKLMIVDTNNLYSTNSSSVAYHQAWASFRTLALGIIIIACLIVVISSAFGFEFLDAYTIKKTLPRIIIAGAGIAISWQMCGFLINLSNDAGIAVREIIYAPFTSMKAYSMEGSTQFLLGFSFAAALVVYQWAILLFVVTGALGIFIAILTLVVREMIIIFCVIIAPVAIACYILPNTQKFWGLWQKTFISLLVVFPIISGFIALGRVFSNIAYADGTSNAFNNIISFIAYFLPYFMIPVAFKMAGGIMTTLSGIGNDRSRGLFDRLSKARGNSAKQNYQDAIKRDSRLGNTAIGSMYRRVHLARQGGLNPFNRQRYADAAARLENKVQREGYDADALQGTANDDVLDQAQDRNIRSAADLRRRYSNLLVHRDGMSREAANALAAREVASVQNALGAPVGSAAFRHRAYSAHQLSSTGFTRRDRDVQLYNEDGSEDILLAAEHGDENLQRMWNQGLALVQEGITTDARVIATAKKNKARPEISNVPFGATLGMLARAQGRAAAGGGPAAVTADEATRAANAALAGSSVNELIYGKEETVRVWSERMSQRSVQLRSQLDAAIRNGNPADVQHATIEYQRHMATVAGMYDIMATASETKGNIIAGGLMHTTLSNGNTVRQEMEAIRARNEDYFLDRRRELNAQAAQQQNNITAGATPTPGAPGAGPP